MTAQVDASPIAMKAVESSRIAELGHNAETNTLAIRFKRGDGSHGALYHYGNFTAEDFATFDSAESLGTHFEPAHQEGNREASLPARGRAAHQRGTHHCVIPCVPAIAGAIKRRPGQIQRRPIPERSTHRASWSPSPGRPLMAVA